MTAVPQSYASIILPDSRAIEPRQYVKSVHAALDRFDPVTDGSPEYSDTENVVLGATYCVKIESEEQSDFGPRIVFRVMRHDQSPSRRTRRMAMIMRQIVRNALEGSEADYIEWMEPQVLLTREEFLEAVASDRTVVFTSGAAPEAVLVEDTSPFDPIESELARLFHQVQEDQIAAAEIPSFFSSSDASAGRRMRVAAWAMTGVIASLSAPVAAAMMVMNAGHGADFRLATQALALTGLGSVLKLNDYLPSLSALL